MNIKSVSINWNLGYANAPEVSIVAEVVPEFGSEEPIYTRQTDGILYAVKNKVVDYILMKPFCNDFKMLRGFGGSTFKRTLIDGTVIESNNCWSSRCACVEIPCKEVIINNSSSAIETDLYIKLVKQAGAYIVDGEISASPTQLTKRV